MYCTVRTAEFGVWRDRERGKRMGKRRNGFEAKNV